MSRLASRIGPHAANLLTLARLAMLPVMALALLRNQPVWALAAYGAAGASDYFDGIAARRWGVSRFGALLDHATDAVFVAGGLAVLAWLELVPFVLPLLVAAAFLQYTLDSRALAGRPLQANPLGRWNGVAYYILLGTPILRDALGLLWPWDSLVYAGGVLLVTTTAVSMTLRARGFLVARRRSELPDPPGTGSGT